jgi:HSP20 family molecular chaperone IbpA
MNNKMRYSIPAKIIELLFTDDAFYSEVLKLKKASGNKFPKSDEWVDENGFNLSFALAGYSSNDVTIDVLENVISIKGSGIDSITSDPLSKSTPEAYHEDDQFTEYSRESRPRIHTGLISRGIARRSFCVKYLISEEFDAFRATALMEHGLLHVVIPLKEVTKHVQIEIKGEK